jgi:aerobic carbon-monoxide dehydrogenase small subunit
LRRFFQKAASFFRLLTCPRRTVPAGIGRLDAWAWGRSHAQSDMSDEWSRKMPQLSLTVNNKPITEEVEARTLLVEFLRGPLGLTGTHIGCDTSQCGACVVSIDGKSVKSCSILAVQVDGGHVTTIEGLAAADGTLHPMQEMFREHHALQCGFCTSGMVMSAIDLVQSHPEGLTETQIRHGLEGNLCRCTGYHNIVKAIAAAWPLMHRQTVPHAAE